jgi:shikimate dehydrogenase
LIGYPVEHSLSPAFQQPALDELGIDATYELWPTPPEKVEARIASLRTPGALGANVTVPHKETVARLMDTLSDTARRAGAVNTIIPRDGLLTGDNTDVPGLARSLGESGFSKPGFAALVLGAGGAAKGAMLALESLGAARVMLANRSIARGRETAAALLETSVEVIPLEAADLLAAIGQADLILNATSLGWKPGETPISVDLLNGAPASCVVFDLTYRDTALLMAARERGLRAVDGLAMLVYQGARSLELWTGREAPVDLMMARAREARAARS